MSVSEFRAHAPSHGYGECGQDKHPPRQLGVRAQKAARAAQSTARGQPQRLGQTDRFDRRSAAGHCSADRTGAHPALNQEFAWKCTASNLTGHLYTNPKMFTHTAADRAGKNPVRWSLKYESMWEFPARKRLETEDLLSALRCGNHF